MADKFDRFTERARRTLTLAQEEAQRFNHNYIGTEHLLLGLIREGDGVAARVLSNMGVQLPKVRSAVEFIIGRGDQAPTGDIGLTPRAKKVIELAVDEARRLNHHYIGTEHLLLGLVREGEGIAAGVLESLGVNLEKVRANVLRIVSADSMSINRGAESEPMAPEIAPTPAPTERSASFNHHALMSLNLAEEEAKRFNHPSIGTEHFLLGLIREWDGIAARVLWDRGVRLVDARRAVELRSPRREEAAPDELYLTRRANMVLELAVNQGRRLNGRAIGAEHLLLGLIRDENGSANLVIADLGIDRVELRSELIRIIAKASDVEDASATPAQYWEGIEGFDRFTARARKVLEIADSEARRFHHDFIGAEHLILGIVKDEDCIAAQIFVNMGIQPLEVRSAVEYMIRREEPALLGEPGLTPRARTALALAANEADQLGQGSIGTEHLLLGLIREGEGNAAAVLEIIRITLEGARVEARRIIE
jgi:ATP-dependent Clp protease ATP-binding subunit ClpA